MYGLEMLCLLHRTNIILTLVAAHTLYIQTWEVILVNHLDYCINLLLAMRFQARLLHWLWLLLVLISNLKLHLKLHLLNDLYSISFYIWFLMKHVNHLPLLLLNQYLQSDLLDNINDFTNRFNSHYHVFINVIDVVIWIRAHNMTWILFYTIKKVC